MPTEQGYEADFKLCVGCFVDHTRHTFRLIHYAFFIQAAIDYRYVAILQPLVLGSYISGALILEPVGQPGDFVPGSDITIEIDLGNGLQRLPLPGRNNACQQGQREAKQ